MMNSSSRRVGGLFSRAQITARERGFRGEDRSRTAAHGREDFLEFFLRVIFRRTFLRRRIRRAGESASPIPRARIFCVASAAASEGLRERSGVRGERGVRQWFLRRASGEFGLTMRRRLRHLLAQQSALRRILPQ